VEGAFIEKMGKIGYKAKEEKGMFNNDKGFRNYRNSTIKEITGTAMDYVVKIERKSRKDKDETTFYLIINKDGTNMMDVLDEAVKDNAKTFLKDLLPAIEAYDLEVKIKDQEESLSKAEKKQKKLEDDLSDMEKKLKKLEDDIDENKKDQEKQKEEIIIQKSALESLKGKRKAN
jgi:peptidoglycan hydrolase CwlO-like protein